VDKTKEATKEITIKQFRKRELRHYSSREGTIVPYEYQRLLRPA
jgi:hypothetical protein